MESVSSKWEPPSLLTPSLKTLGRMGGRKSAINHLHFDVTLSLWSYTTVFAITLQLFFHVKSCIRFEDRPWHMTKGCGWKWVWSGAGGFKRLSWLGLPLKKSWSNTVKRLLGLCLVQPFLFVFRPHRGYNTYYTHLPTFYGLAASVNWRPCLCKRKAFETIGKEKVVFIFIPHKGLSRTVCFAPYFPKKSSN